MSFLIGGRAKMTTRFNWRFLFDAWKRPTTAGDTVPNAISATGSLREKQKAEPLTPPRHSATMGMRSRRYLLSGLRQVDGWLVPTTAHILATLAEQQTSLGIRGDLAEIGIHHGKSFLVLANSIAAGEKIFAIDVFDDQHKNPDQSGLGDRQVFLKNINLHASGIPLEIIQESSLDLPSIGWPQGHANSIRFFSIDGSHTREATLNDLKIAQRTTKDGGIVAVDDLLSAHWLGVISGLSDYLASGGELVPFAIIPDKLLLSKGQGFKETWKELIRSQYGGFISKRDVKLFDYPVDVVEENFSILKELEAQGS